MKIKVRAVSEAKTQTGKFFLKVLGDDGTEYRVWEMSWHKKFELGKIVDLDAEGLMVRSKMFRGKEYKSIVEKESKQEPDKFEMAQDKKAKSVSNAQTRNEKMWAKYNACELVAAMVSMNNYDQQTDIKEEVEKLAKWIYNLELEEEVELKEPKIYGDLNE